MKRTLISLENKDRKCFLKLLNAVLTKLPKLIAKSPKVFRSKSENEEKVCFFSARNPSKCSAGHVEINFDKAAEVFALKVRKKFAQSKKMVEGI